MAQPKFKIQPNKTFVPEDKCPFNMSYLQDVVNKHGPVIIAGLDVPVLDDLLSYTLVDYRRLN